MSLDETGRKIDHGLAGPRLQRQGAFMDIEIE